MRILRILIILCMAALFQSCASVNVGYDYDPEIDFSSFRTYDWFAVPEKAKFDELSLKHIKRAIEQDLEAKGYTRQPAGPDFFVAIHGKKEKKVDIREWGYVYGRHGYYWGDPYWGRHYPRRHYFRHPYWTPVPQYGFERRVDRYEYEVGMLTIDIVAAGTKELVWRGTATTETDPYRMGSAEERMAVINDMVAGILKNFPPS